MPESVLRHVWRWKAGKKWVEEEKMPLEEKEKLIHSEWPMQKDYMFMTTNGGRVSSHDCTARFLCQNCENKFQDVDKYASPFWKNMPRNWEQKDESEGIMKVVLFSMVGRGMWLSLAWSDYHLNLKRAFKEMMNESQTEPYTYHQTKKILDEIGFMYCYLPQGDQSYRVEFPFPCILRLQRGQCFKAVCAQVPPFFCILPEDSKDKVTLKDNLHDIMRHVHEKLQWKLQEYAKETNEQAREIKHKIRETKDEKELKSLKKRSKRLECITTFLNNNPVNGCLLFFRYLPKDENEALEVDAYV